MDGEGGGLVKKPQTIDIDTIMAYRPIEERVYRFRCVEAWSMVIPWAGYPLAEFVKAMDPLPSAKFVQFFSDKDRRDGTAERHRISVLGGAADG